MTAVVTPREASDSARVLLRGVSWGTYERLLAEHPDSAGPRFTYDNGFLEILTLYLDHEHPNRTLASLVQCVLAEWDIDFFAAGSTTFKRTDLAKGFEPDSSFYIRQPERVRGKKRLDLAVDPPPDLVIEIEVTEPALPRLPIFAAVGVSEVWRYDGAGIHLLVLGGEGYVETAQSRLLPGLSGETISDLLGRSAQMKSPAWMRLVREWAQAHRP